MVIRGEWTITFMPCFYECDKREVNDDLSFYEGDHFMMEVNYDWPLFLWSCKKEVNDDLYFYEDKREVNYDLCTFFLWRR